MSGLDSGDFWVVSGGFGWFRVGSDGFGWFQVLSITKNNYYLVLPRIISMKILCVRQTLCTVIFEDLCGIPACIFTIMI